MQLAGTVGAGWAVASCAGPGSSGGGADEARDEPIPTGPVEGEVSFAHWRAEDQAAFDQLIAAFRQETGVTVRQDISPSNDYQSTALQRVRGGGVGDVLTAFRGAQFNDMVSAGVYSDLTDQDVVGQYDSQLIEVGRQDGTQWGLPYQVVFNMPVANLDLLERAGATGAPQDWQGFLALCEDLQALGVVPIAWPAAAPGDAGQLLNAMVMNNAPADDMFVQVESGDLKVTDEWFLTTLRQYEQLRPFFQPRATGTAVEPAQQLFASGQAAMLATGSYHIAPVRALGAQFPMDLVAPITVPADQAKYEGIYNATFILGVNTASDVRPAGLAWVEFLSRPENASAYANATAQHVTVSGATYENQDLERTSPWLTRDTLLAPRFQFDDLDVRAAVENAAVAVVGGTSPEQAAEEAQRVVDQAQ
ncbi:carbohydrate ABC transporter substrate-binding protein [Vallicoccus soli]|uniref:Carbohydrate ABC transporter substrate-binding protein n=2 Tax=Vallicoccus soli TaxID=2339232 RepID=A0A3A3ZHV0_9ACTN|nr:carbohydrate ABC transporter substrate-binding protein [Vallicoccus soli]